MKWNNPFARTVIKYFFILSFLFLLLPGVRAQSNFRSYSYWSHPAIQALEKHDPSVIAFPRPGSNLVNLCIADTTAGIAYFVSQYGFVFDTLHLTSDRKKEIQIAGKKTNPFQWFETNLSRYLPLLQDAKEFLRENGNSFKKSSYTQQRVLTLPSVNKASSTLAKLLAIEEYERESKLILVHFNWWINSPKESAVQNRVWEGQKPGSLVVHGSLDSGYSEFINKELFSKVRKARLDHATGMIQFYDWKNKSIDSFLVKKNKAAVLVKEKTDVFVLYRAWLEWNLQNVSASIPAWQYAANYELLKNKEYFIYADLVNERSSRASLNTLQEEKRSLLDKISALADADRDLFSMIIAHPRYDRYTERREWFNDNWATSVTYTRGHKRYELTDHRGNVMATVSDRKTGIDVNSDGLIDAYEADITTATDYYPFGSQVPGRKYNKDEKYRYGFNGKENDNEVKGEGNQQDYGMRIYDPRVGRFLSVDPITKKFPELTPYQFASNTPVKAIDLDGMETSWRPDGQTAPGKNDHKFGAQSTSQNTPAISVPPPNMPGINMAIYQSGSNTPAKELELQKKVAARKAAGGFFDTHTLNEIKNYNIERVENSAAANFPVVGSLLRAGNYEMLGYHSEAGDAAVDFGKEVAITYIGGKIVKTGIQYFGNAAKTGSGVGTATGAQYSVAYEMKLSNNLYPGKGYSTHFKAANTSLNNSMASDVRFANSMSTLGISIPRSATGNILGKSPSNWVWHHNVNNGIMQLVPKSQHVTNSIFWKTMHPDGKGGMSIWGR